MNIDHSAHEVFEAVNGGGTSHSAPADEVKKTSDALMTANKADKT